jgi:hypothetical protein
MVHSLREVREEGAKNHAAAGLYFAMTGIAVESEEPQ